jgi:3-hydroxy acid dehydrogenase / malonic semialdehyde reductase
MESLNNTIVLITGASSGIGQAAAEHFAAAGARVILTARRVERLQELATTLQQQHGTDVHSIQLDVQDKNAVAQAINNLPEKWQDIDILLNNAGVAITSDLIQDGQPNNWDTMIDTNIKGVLYLTHAVLPGMLVRNSGHIINTGSIAGHECYLGGNVYSATKHAVRSLSKSLRVDLGGSAIRVSEVDPGAVNTEFSTMRWQDKNKADNFYNDFDPLVATDIAECILFCATRPAHVNIAELVVYPTEQASANHLNKRDATQKKSIFD